VNMRATSILCLLVTVMPALLFGQSEADAQSNLPGVPESILRVQGVSVYGGYYTSGMPVGFETSGQNTLPGPTVMAGSTITIGGLSSRERSSLDWSYSPSYFSTVYSDNKGVPNHGSLNHRLNVNWNRKLGSKWTLFTSVNGFLASLEQLYFAPGLLSSVAAMPTTFDGLAAAILAGKFTDPQLAALLTGSPVQASPEQAFPYGTRLMNAAVDMGLAWAPSGRTTLALTLTGTRTQRVDGAGTTGANQAISGLTLPQITNAAASMSWSYSVSPRTQISVQAISNRTFSRIQQGYASNMNFSIGRRLSRRLFVQAKGGGGTLTYSHVSYAQPKTAQYLFGGNIGFKTSSHTLLAGYDRTLGDAYGLGSGTTGSATAGWSWQRPGSTWSASAGASYQQLNNPLFRNTRSWRVNAGLSRFIGDHVVTSCQYVYFQLPADMRIVGRQNVENGVLLSLAWVPSQHRSVSTGTSGK
jgi:hypothetical protein